MKPYIHALSSAKKHGGEAADYLDIHNLMDSSKAAMADNRHRALTHNAWFIGTILEKIFGVVRYNSAGKAYSVRDIGEEHVLEDNRGKFIPCAQDYLQEMEMKPWMQNGAGVPPSCIRLYKEKKHVGSTEIAGESARGNEGEAGGDQQAVPLDLRE